MLIEIRKDGKLIHSFEESDTRMETNPTLLQVDCIDNSNPKNLRCARAFLSGKVVRGRLCYELAAMAAHQVDKTATATFKPMDRTEDGYPKMLSPDQTDRK